MIVRNAEQHAWQTVAVLALGILGAALLGVLARPGAALAGVVLGLALYLLALARAR